MISQQIRGKDQEKGLHDSPAIWVALLQDMRMHVGSWSDGQAGNRKEVEASIGQRKGHLQKPYPRAIKSEAARDLIKFVGGLSYVSFCSDKKGRGQSAGSRS